VRFLAGWYLLFALVDDIPSIGKMVRITPTLAPSLRVPSVSITSTDSTASEPGSDTASFTITRTGVTNAPLLVTYTIDGTAVNGVDYNALSNFVVIPAGAFSATRTPTPIDDPLSEGTESISISLTNTPYYNAAPATSVILTLSDNEPAPPSLSLQLVSLTNGLIDLTLSGAATRLFAIETSSNFNVWQPVTTLLTISNATHFLDQMPTNAPHLFFRAREEE